ncbi:DUF4307 domain-containing protein [Nocardioides perillae]|uniref:DUF4307 domain-containing protein n=1 Tax=Nocardioides perillae TaxID=1119534 RepID=A0A7Y9RUC2_9ACTN|nr:DUF4307 domain-containing protein [Nocardioides perillae]NYG56781.1 hypothetical protein [Nocardioides perillae]
MQGSVSERDALLAERYGAPARRSRLPVVVTAAASALVFGGWLAWTAWDHATPDVTSEMVGYEIDPPHRATGTVDVAIADGVDPADVTCTLRALAWDKATVGELAFSPAGSGRQTLEVRTEREATSVDVVGCTTPDQQRAR